jgi:hypothetical protein
MRRIEVRQLAAQTSEDTVDQRITGAMQCYAEWARGHQHVVAIIAVPAASSTTVWTVLDGDSCGETRRGLYGLQVRTWEAFPGKPLAFRVIDLAEYPGTPLETLVPSDGGGPDPGAPFHAHRSLRAPRPPDL